MIRETVEIVRSPQDVFAYLDRLDRHGEWQDGILAARVETEGPVRVGTVAVETRKVPGGKRDIRYEITVHDPPQRVSFRGIAGPVLPLGAISVEPSGDGSRVTIELDFEGHGAGKLLLPLVRREAAREVPRSYQRVKERLEAGA